MNLTGAQKQSINSAVSDYRGEFAANSTERNSACDAGKDCAGVDLSGYLCWEVNQPAWMIAVRSILHLWPAEGPQ
jgi:hypothetical protein